MNEIEYSHIEDHQSYFNRTKLVLASDNSLMLLQQIKDWKG